MTQEFDYINPFKAAHNAFCLRGETLFDLMLHDGPADAPGSEGDEGLQPGRAEEEEDSDKLWMMQLPNVSIGAILTFSVPLTVLKTARAEFQSVVMDLLVTELARGSS